MPMLCSLVGQGDAKTSIAKVINGVVLAEENIAKNPEGSSRSRYVQPSHAKEAHGLSSLGNFQHVLGSLENVIHATERDGDVRQARDEAAIDRVLVGVEQHRLCADRFGDGLDFTNRASQDRGARVRHRLAHRGDALSLHRHVGEIELPVRLQGEWRPVDIARELAVVDAAPSELPGAPVLSQIERKDGLLHQALINGIDKGGTTPSTEIRGQPMPQIPSNLASWNDSPGSSVASAKVCDLMGSPPTVTTSVLKKPSSEPLPYSMWNAVPLGWYVEDFDE